MSEQQNEAEEDRAVDEPGIAAQDDPDPEASIEDVDPEASVDEAVEESFPGSDPPATWAGADDRPR